LADFLGWKEFTVSFLVMSLATAMPEMLVGISSAMRNIPELSFGNIMGQTIIHFTIAVAVCVFVGGSFKVESQVVRYSAWFAGIMALLPMFLIFDGVLSRLDGVMLILGFIFYIAWSFSKYKRFSVQYERSGEYPTAWYRRILAGFRDISRFFVAIIITLIAAQGIVMSTTTLAITIGMPLIIVGALIVGLGTSLPEMYFSAMSAYENKKSLMLGNLLGSTAVSVSLVMGSVAIISPIVITDFSPYLVNRVFLLVSVAFFIFFMLTGRRITRLEGWALLSVYIIYVVMEIIWTQ